MTRTLWTTPGDASAMEADAQTVFPITGPFNGKRFNRDMPDLDFDLFCFTKPRMLPEPQLRKGDTRFHKDTRNRKIRCDGGCNQTIEYRRGFDGDYVHFPEEIKQCRSWTEALAVMQEMHAHKLWNATWLCSWCWKEIYEHQCGRTITIHEIRQKIRLSRTKGCMFAQKAH